EVVLDERRRRPGDEDLAAVAEVADPRRLVDSEADVALPVDRRLARVQAEPDPHGRLLGPVVGEHRALGRGRGEDGGARAPEDEEERIALAVDLDPSVGREGLPENRVVCRKQLAVPVAAELFQEARGASMSEKRKVTVPEGRSRLPVMSPF